LSIIFPFTPFSILLLLLPSAFHTHDLYRLCQQ
jgi:hypothetical protein